MDDISTQSEALRNGHFARKQIFCKDRLISWAHQRRFQVALELARSARAKRMLDYGCGDGTFLALLMSDPLTAPSFALGCEVEQRVVEECRQRLCRYPNLDFTRIADLDRTEHRSSFDAVFCMEVLEHVVMPDEILDRLARVLAPHGRLYISVPVEIGPPLIAKQVLRRVAGWRGIGHYPGQTPYTFAEFCRSLLAGSSQHITRPVLREPNGFAFYDHKGFNWRVLKDALGRRFRVERVICSPVTWLPSAFASQVWFVLAAPIASR